MAAAERTRPRSVPMPIAEPIRLPACVALVLLAVLRAPSATTWDTHSDTWVATDGLGRSLPTFDEAGPPRVDRTVALFYFLWHGAHAQGGPYDISRILATDPEAMEKPDSPLWGPLHAPHHWGESVFGYYRSDDRGVLRKHAQMLSDAGANMYGCKMTVDMWGLSEDDFLPCVDKVVTASDFMDMTEGAQIVFI